MVGLILFCAGAGAGGIADALNARGVATARGGGGQLYAMTVKNVLARA